MSRHKKELRGAPKARGLRPWPIWPMHKSVTVYGANTFTLMKHKHKGHAREWRYHYFYNEVRNKIKRHTSGTNPTFDMESQTHQLLLQLFLLLLTKMIGQPRESMAIESSQTSWLAWQQDNAPSIHCKDVLSQKNLFPQFFHKKYSAITTLIIQNLICFETLFCLNMDWRCVWKLRSTY